MRIIVEGMDGAGKSRLVYDLWIKFHQLEPIVNELGPEQDLVHWWQQQLSRSGDFLHDRFFYSELVYGPLLRGSLKPTLLDIETISKGLRQNALLIYCRPSRQTIYNGSKQRDQMNGVHDKFHELLDTYDHIMDDEANEYGRRFHRYNWRNTEEPERVMELVRSYLAGELT